MLLLVMGLMQTYSFLRHHFSGINELKKHVAVLEHKVEVEKTKTYVAYHEAESIRQELATLMPNKIYSKTDYQSRKLASVLQAQQPIEFDRSESYLKKGKEMFNKKRPHEAITVFHNLIARYPDSQSAVEAYFLLAESYFQVHAVEDCIDTIESMVTLYPESELTGFALLRLSAIYFSRKLDDDAVLVLQTVRHNFSFNKELVEQATIMLKKAQL